MFDVRALRRSFRRLYSDKVVVSGNIVELYEYENSIVLGETNNMYGRSISASEEDKARHRKYTLARANRELRRIINANAYAWGEKPKFVTLTFAENVQDVKQANYEFKLFRQRLEYLLKLKLKYVVKIEFQKRGAIHYHVVFFNLPYVQADFLASVWRNGFIKVNAIDHVDNIGAYVTKYMTKDADDDRLQGQKSYFTSRGLIKPVEKYLNEKEIADIKDKLSHAKVYENTFANEYTGNILYTQYNLNRTDNSIS